MEEIESDSGDLEPSWTPGSLAYSDEDEEDDDRESTTARAEWQRFSRMSKLDNVMDHWDASQLQTERPIPECAERNF